MGKSEKGEEDEEFEKVWESEVKLMSLILFARRQKIISRSDDYQIEQLAAFFT